MLRRGEDMVNVCPICKGSDQTEAHSFTPAKESNLGIPIRCCPSIAEGTAYLHAGTIKPAEPLYFEDLVGE